MTEEQNTKSALRASVLSSMRTIFGDNPSGLALYESPPGDPGLFGPGSMAWKVHGDLPAMLIGGLSALMLQTLHPLAMAGVVDHSGYRTDPIGRFRRTAAYVAGTTYGSVSLAERLIDRVLAVHDGVNGRAKDGRAYSANDPDLLTWVHTCEVYSFLSSYQRYAPRPLLRQEKERYLCEVALLGRRLGAREVPQSLSEVRSYFSRVEHDLCATDDARKAVAFLLNPIEQTGKEALAQRVITDAAYDLLPGFAVSAFRPMNPIISSPLTRLGAKALSALIRLSVGPSPVVATSTARATARRAE